MISLTKFPALVTNESDQSRTQGAKLDSLLGSKTPQEITSSLAILQEVIVELWYETPCLNIESIIHCLPIYVAYMDALPQLLIQYPELPPDWQIFEDYAYRIYCFCSNPEWVSRKLTEFSDDEVNRVFELCDKIEASTDESVEEFRILLRQRLSGAVDGQ